jgi:hypothetical protein
MGFRDFHADRPNTSNSISGHETFEIQQLTKRENSSSESIADADAGVLLASVLSDHNDDEHENTLPSQAAVATRPETGSKGDDEKVIHIVDIVEEKNEDYFLAPSPTTAPMASGNNEGLFDFYADPSSSPAHFVSQASSATLQSTTNHLTRSSESPTKKATASPTQ